MTNLDLAQAFSRHRFADTFERLAPGVVWNLVGQVQLHGRDAVIAACESSTAENARTTTTWLRFVATSDGPVVAVDAVGRYDGPEGRAVVSSCDIYEFVDGFVTMITSYATELDPDSLPDS